MLHAHRANMLYLLALIMANNGAFRQDQCTIVNKTKRIPCMVSILVKLLVWIYTSYSGSISCKVIQAHRAKVSQFWKLLLVRIMIHAHMSNVVYPFF